MLVARRLSTIATWTLGVAIAAATPACSRSSDGAAIGGQIADLERQQAARRADLDQIRQQIEAARLELSQAQRRAEYARCEANRSEFRSAVSQRRSQCLAVRMQFAQCMATRARGESNGTFAGALLGIGLAVVTGGATAPLALGGGIIGRGVGGSGTPACGPSPVCVDDENEIERAIASEGRARPAACGAPPSDASTFSRCTVTTLARFHLRPEATGASVGTQMPRGTRVGVLERTESIRGASRLYRVQVVGGASGWMFLGRNELASGGCPWTD